MKEADGFYEDAIPANLTSEQKNVARQAYAGLVWTKQFYHFVVEDWMVGDPYEMPPPGSRRVGRNSQWLHVFAKDILSMPDKWEYPWFAAWDLAFHMVPYARIDPHLPSSNSPSSCGNGTCTPTVSWRPTSGSSAM